MWTDARLDLGLGLGWRHVWDAGVMLGINTFWDTSLFEGDWYSSPGLGLEFAADSAHGAWDLILNVYRGGGIDLKSGFTFPVWEDRLDMRLFVEKYRFFDGEFILGSKAGLEISAPARLLAVSYEYGQDSQNPEYHAIACSLTVPFRLENIFRGKNPIERPDWPDQGYRYTQRLQSEGVKRTWRRPDTVVEARNTPQGERWTTPGKLADLMFKFGKSTEPVTQTTKAAKVGSKTCQNPKDCEYKPTEKAGEDSGSGTTLLGWLLGTSIGRTVCVGAATYVGGDYAYRNAFGPFEIEPYEKAQIRQEMPKKQRRK